MATRAEIGSEIGAYLRFLRAEMRPKGKLLTPFNIISLPIMAVGAVLVVIRFAMGLGSVTNLSQETPWGFWIGFDVVTGVAGPAETSRSAPDRGRGRATSCETPPVGQPPPR